MISSNSDRSVTFPYLCALGVILVGALIMGVKFLPVLNFGEDGFQSELVYALFTIDNGLLFERGAESPLVFVHITRLLAVAPFLLFEGIFGAAGQIGLLLLALSPLVLRPYKTHSSILYLLPFLLPLAISGRAVLVATGLGYIVFYMQSSKNRPWFLWMGILWVILSSASVMMSLLLLLFAVSRSGARQYGVQRWIAIGVLLGFFAISAIDKLIGLQAGEEGYGAHAFESDNIFLILLSRSTLLASFTEGQYLRALVYSIVTVYFLYKASRLLFARDDTGMKRVIFCCLPGIPMEGLGMLALCLPLLWVFLNFDPRKI